MSGETSYILGISAFYHDSAACLLRDGEILAAAQEERFTRQKGDASEHSPRLPAGFAAANLLHSRGDEDTRVRLEASLLDSL